MAIFSFTNITVSLVSLYVVRRIYWEATTGTRRRALAKQHGCLPPQKRLNRVLPNLIDLFGVDMVISNYRAYKAHRKLEQEANDLRDAGAHTIQAKVFGLNIFITDDPENVKCLLATNSDTWSLGQSRIKVMSSYLGHGIFTNEGKAWKHSRDMLHGSEVDLQPLFHELTLDVATDFLFGRSTNSLNRADESEDVKEFIESFEYCLDPLSSDNCKRFGYLGLLLPDRKKKRSVKFIQDFTDKVIDEELRLKEETQDKQDSRYIFLHDLITATQDRTVPAANCSTSSSQAATQPLTSSQISSENYLATHPFLPASAKKSLPS
ncbi:Nn.00g091470.m01.CDS01 [Neocucurbitaria sp. VM-36]